MSSIFQDMDVLYYIYNKRIRPGDVIVFKIPEYEYKITHRVISVGKKGIRTMGDCNPHPDSWLLRPDQVLGYVAYGYRGKRRFSVLNGPAGLVNIFRFRFKLLIIKKIGNA
jgi:signal peptidase I